MNTSIDISIYTSVYRGEAHLPQYTQAVLNVGRTLKEAGVGLEIVIISNDATDTERQLIEQLVTQAQDIMLVTPLFVGRETLYASWNRGIKAASGDYFGSWNIDDIRTAEGLLDGLQRFRDGCDLVEFATAIVRHTSMGQRTQVRAPYYKPQMIHRKARLSPFFMFSKSLYEHAGDFDPNFRIAGDFEWGSREIVRNSNVCHSDTVAGEFHIHGGNLSGSGDQLVNIRETLEDNMTLMRYQVWDIEQIRPLPDHQAIKTAWDEWGNPGDVKVPHEIANKLWGEQAESYWQQWKTEYVKRQRGYQLRRIPRAVIDATGLRPILARFGIVKRANS